MTAPPETCSASASPPTATSSPSGASEHDAAGATPPGAAYLFDATTGQQLLHKLVADDAEPSARFGRAVAVDGNVVVVGAPFDDGTGRRLRLRASRAGTAARKADVASDAQPGDGLGSSVGDLRHDDPRRRGG